MRLALPLLLGLTFAAISPSDTGAQSSSTLTGVVRSAFGGPPLAFARVAIPELELERFTDSFGRFTFSDLPLRSVELQVRRIGFAPKDLRVTLHPGIESLDVDLDRFVVALEPIRVRAHPPCKRPGAPRGDTALVLLFTQLSLNAQQYQVLAEKYPFQYGLEIVAGYVDSSGAMIEDRRDTIGIDGIQNWRYRPGNIVSTYREGRIRRRLQVNLPTLVDFADDSFVGNHCFHNMGLVTNDSGSMYRIDFVPADRLRSTDFSGEIYLDSATFQIRRTVLRVENGARTIRGLKEMWLTTDFAEVLPSIPVIARVSSWQEYHPRTRGVIAARNFENQRLLAFRFIGRKPGS